MKAAVVYGLGDLRLEEVPVPPVPAGSIRVKVQACSICGTDIRIYRKYMNAVSFVHRTR